MASVLLPLLGLVGAAEAAVSNDAWKNWLTNFGHGLLLNFLIFCIIEDLTL